MPWKVFHWILKFYYWDFSAFMDSPWDRYRQSTTICSKSTIAYLKTKYGEQLSLGSLRPQTCLDQKSRMDRP